jgi:hypothetical protein
VCFNIGEPVIAIFQSNDIILTQGFQQPCKNPPKRKHDLQKTHSVALTVPNGRDCQGCVVGEFDEKPHRNDIQKELAAGNLAVIKSVLSLYTSFIIKNA